jgi:hypothetical protein
MFDGVTRLLLLVAALRASTVCSAADYLQDVKPLLKHKCYACHGALKQQAGLRLDTAASLMAGGDSGAAVMPGSPRESLLMGVVTGDAGFRMPPENEGSPLTAEEVDVMREWIAAGASAPKDEVPEADPRLWWSYRPIERPPLPTVSDASWCRGEIDCFVAARRTQAGLPHVTEASKEIWLRRVFLDLTGLPPTRRDQQQFLSDDSPTAYEAVVDDLLGRPQYGERWGRHWMDIWRYSDWYGSRGGNEIRYSQRHIWRWRDWIVSSLNADRGYDQMIREMLAGDEIASDDPAVLSATGYLGRNWYKFDRNAWMFETVERAGEAFLGLTFRCCRCHDHKFDPVTQEEYYRFRAFFEPHDVRTDPISAFTGTHKDATLGQVLNDGIACVFDKTPDTPTYRFERGDGRHPDKSQPLSPGVPAALGGDINIHPVDLPVAAWYPVLRAGVRETLIAKAEADVRSATEKLRDARLKAKAVSDQQDPNSAPSAESQRTRQQAAQVVTMAQAELNLAQGEAAWTRVRLAADVEKYINHNQALASRHDQVARDARQTLEVLKARVDVVRAAGSPDKAAKAQLRLTAALDAAKIQSGESVALGEQYPKTSTGRRTALADWITSPTNPRTARVAANHIWGRHFGQPLVATPENFGLNGRKPTHPQLLDWLAAELVANEWKMKPLHRQLVLSATYRMASAPWRSSAVSDHMAEARQRDAKNRFFWRMNSRRMEAEVVRDSTLFLSSRLDTTFGGPEIPETDGDKHLRRSLYFRNTPNEKMLMLDTFDVADPNACYRRKASIVPAQSLAMMNSGLVQDSARMIAKALAQETDFVTAAFETVLARRPAAAETQRCQGFLVEHARQHQQEAGPSFPAGGSARLTPSKDPELRARENLIHVLFLHNDFVTIR